MPLEVVEQFALGDEQNAYEFVYLRIIDLGLSQNLLGEVDWSFDLLNVTRI